MKIGEKIKNKKIAKMKTIALQFPLEINQFYLRINLKVLWVFVILFVLIFVFLSVFQINMMTRETYSIRDYQNKIRELSLENKALSINLSQTDSLARFEILVQGLNLEKADRVQYIQVLAGQVVAK
ncbi:MAG: hypothetical protein A3H01_00515 [Candidatus Wildermuthbacteria bacterium RIFCSPLOWO2_12_FULL_40_9]|uniref:Cell division protein FtsL n=1 Tax=Candidatus Wildermuthbacteria bacterium RIFCSPLOWO2_12_FULL_40_9 TaxID=1802467 RepID=A0A1G2RVA6_9BACT|nr:MAG: hypothetical protein A3H01_00515 [Candidatus Wildermuthbacteria bacterium RIFCSPLOWO2_12_FULL_40_9]